MEKCCLCPRMCGVDRRTKRGFCGMGENPVIARAALVEKGGAGATLSPVARKIVDYYFTFQSSANTVENAYSLLK